jgi:hypothetical protein
MTCREENGRKRKEGSGWKDGNGGVGREKRRFEVLAASRSSNGRKYMSRR